MEKRARYTVECPIKFTFISRESLDRAELLEEAKRQMRNALYKGNLEMLTNSLMVIDKEKILTPQEKKAEEQFWFNILFRR